MRAFSGCPLPSKGSGGKATEMFEILRSKRKCFRNGRGTSLAAQWLRLCTSTAGDMGSIPGGGTKIPHAAPHGQKTKQNKTRMAGAKSSLI